MSAAVGSLAIGRTFVSAPFLVDSDAAHAYSAAIEAPPRHRPRPTIHSDSEAARTAGFRAPIAAGEQTYALMVNFIVDTFGIGFARGGRATAAMIKPVFYGDRLIMHLKVTGAGAGGVQLEIWTDNDRGERVLAGTAHVPSHESRA